MAALNIAPNGYQIQPNGLLGFNPTAQRQQALYRGLLQAGMGLLSQGYSPVPVSFGQSIAQGLGGFARGVDEGRQTYFDDWQRDYQMRELERKENQRNASSAAIDRWISMQAPEKQIELKALRAADENVFTEEWVKSRFDVPEAPKTREYRSGNQQITEEWNPATRSWKRVGIGQAFSDKPLVQIGGDNAADAELRKSLSGKEGERWSEVQQSGLTASGMIQDLEIMDELSKYAPQGAITGRFVEMFPGISTSGDAFESVAKRVAPSLRTPGSGSTSDVEYEGFLKSMPRLRNTEGGNQVISAVLKAKAEINVQRANIITRYQNEEISASQAREQLAALNRLSILTPELKTLIQQSVGGDLKKKYGLE
jgi:hypothetical protein